MAEQQKKRRWTKYDPTDLLGAGLTFLSIISSIVLFILEQKNETKITFAIALGVQALGCVIGIYLIYAKNKYRNKYEEKAAANSKELDAVKEQLNKEQKTTSEHMMTIKGLKQSLDDYKQLVHVKMEEIGGSLKSQSIHSNSILVNVAVRSAEQFEQIEELKLLQQSQEEKESKSKIQIERYSIQLFDLFKSYSHNLTDDAKQMINAYLKIKNIVCSISLAIELLEEPYLPEKSHHLEDLRVYTAFRDHDTYSKFRDANKNAKSREIGKIKYEVKENSDFLQCLSAAQCYIMNNATPEDRNIKYEPQRGFHDFYNCSMVVPIMIRSGGSYLYFGFMCCDCMNKDKTVDVFDTASTQLLYVCAQNMGTFLETMDTNWIERIKEFEGLPENILQMLMKKSYKEV